MTSIEALYQIYQEYPIISTDSRKIETGCIFFALQGDNFDGNAYALEALNKGAAYAVVDDYNLPEDERLLFVEDSLLALQELAALHRATLSKPVIAITGTNGKTTTKELTAAVLSKSYNLLYTEGNLNNHIGVPLTLLRLKPEHDFALIEMGASKPGDIAELCEIAQPNYGLITNIGEAHLEGFQSIVGVERTKAELYDWLREHDGKAIRKEEDERLARQSRGIPAVTYGQSPDAVIWGTPLKSDGGDMFLSFEWSAKTINIETQTVKTQLVGNYNIDNALAAIALGLFFGVDSHLINEALQEYIPSNSRSQYLETTYNSIIVDAYNANPSSMEHAINNFIQLSSARSKVAILGDMNELGHCSEQAHKKLYAHIKEQSTLQDLKLIFCGPLWAAILTGCDELCFQNVDALEQDLRANPLKDRIILVKGSNGIQLNRIIGLL